MAELTALGCVSLDLIKPNPNNPRRDFDEAKLRALADSFAANGGRPFTPLIVVRDGSSGFMIVDGERRYRAMRLAGEVDNVDVVVADGAEAAYAMAAMMATDSKERLTDVERAVGTQQMLMLGVEPDVVDKTAGLASGQARKVKALVEVCDEPVQITLNKLFRVAAIDDALEREQLMDMAAGQTEEEVNRWDSPFLKMLEKAEGAQRRARVVGELREWLDDHGVACAAVEPECMRCAKRLYTWDLNSADPFELKASGAVVTVDGDGYSPAICLWEPAEREETEDERLAREERERYVAAHDEFVAEMQEASNCRIEWLCGWLRAGTRSCALPDILLGFVRETSNFDCFADEFECLDVAVSDLTRLALPLIGVERFDALALDGAQAYARRSVKDGDEADEVRGWLGFLHALSDAGYSPTDFEVRAKTTLTGLLKAWDAEHYVNSEAVETAD